MSIVENFSIEYNDTNEMNSLFWEPNAKSWISYLPILFSFLTLEYQPWVMSMLGSFLVGMSGILPLVIIPLDETAVLKTGTGAKTLRVLLSFAVGGLLGDVFLHLLPEAWSNQYSDVISTRNEHPSIYCGLWVLTGLLAFIIVEKMFSFEKENEDDTDIMNENIEPSMNSKTASIRRKKSSFILNDLTVNYVTESKILKTLASTVTSNNSLIDIKFPQLVKKPSNIHVSGYLNLMANSIDNFTHGLAVGGSFMLSTRVGVFTTFAILVHEIPHEVGDFAILLRAGFTRWDAAWAQVYTASAGLLGALTALIFSASANTVDPRTSWILPFTAGGFLHIALVTVLPELLDEKNPRESLKQMCSLASGITVMALMTALVEG